MRLRLLSSLIAATALVAGCVGIGDIDRTQPDKVKKTIFKNDDGSAKEYFFRQTVIDVPATTGVSFIGEQGDAERVVFEVTEDYLYVYRSYGWLGNEGTVEGNQGDEYVRPGVSFQGAPLAAYPISSHFDVKRSYNPSTGEQTNVLVEDTQDKPWNQREYMRVDWGTNAISDFRFGFASVIQTALNSEIPEVDDNPELTKDRPVITADYLDVVTRFHVEPEHMDWSAYGYGKVPMCYLYTGAYKDCSGGTLRVRASFVPVDKLPRYATAESPVGGKSDYTALNYDDLRFQKFGFFRTERFAFNDDYDVIEGSQIRLANRWNLWKDAASCYDADADLPYAACKPEQLRPIVYYINDDFPTAEFPELHTQAMENGEEWNQLFRTAIKATTGWTDAQLGDKRLFTMCPNNPVKAGDPTECGAENLNPQIGDLRYSMYYYVPQYQESSPLGYGPSASDPNTGEIIQGNAFYYGQPAITLARRTLDILKLELDIKTREEIMDGSDIRALQANGLGVNSPTIFKKTASEIGRETAKALKIGEKGARLKRMVQTGQARVDRRATRKNAVKTSGLVQSVMTDEMREAFLLQTIKQGTPIGDVDATIAAGMMDDDFLFANRAERELRAIMTPNKACAILAEDVFDEGLLGLLRVVRRRFYEASGDSFVLKSGISERDVQAFMVASTMGDTQLHEIGHTVGLRHNFAGSADPLNFGKAYWDERIKVRNAGDERSLPEWNIDGGGASIALAAAIDAGMRDNQDSSVMDYASTYGTNTNLGSYDLAAIKYAYGDMVEVFDGPTMTPARARLLEQGEMHYSFYPEAVSDAGSPEERAADLYKRKNVNFRNVKRLDVAVDGDDIEVPYGFCSDEYRDASATCALWDAGADNYERTHYAVQKYRSYRVFNSFKRERLVFGLDVFAYLSRVYSRDFTYMLNQYKNWVNDELIIRSDRPCLVVENGVITDVTDASGRYVTDACGFAGYVGTIETVNEMAQVLASPDVGCYARLENGCYETTVGNTSTSFPPTDGVIRRISTDPGVCDAHVPVQNAANDMVAWKITNQMPYLHVRDSVSCDGYVPPVVTDAAAADAPIANVWNVSEQLDKGEFVRPANTLYDREQYGYYFYNKPIVMGSWWEKWLAIKAIGDGNTDFIGVDASSDTRSYLINLNTLFGDDLNNLVGSTVTDETSNYGALMSSNGKIEMPRFIRLFNSDPTIDRANLPRPAVNPDQQYTFRLLAMYNSAYNGQNTDDYEFGESLFVGMRRSITDVDVPAIIRNDPTRYVEVSDPVSGMRYFAIHQNRNGDELYSIGYEYLRSIKDRYYVGGLAGPGLQFKPEYANNQFEPRNDLEIAQMMAETVRTFGYPDVWSGDLGI